MTTDQFPNPENQRPSGESDQPASPGRPNRVADGNESTDQPTVREQPVAPDQGREPAAWDQVSGDWGAQRAFPGQAQQPTWEQEPAAPGHVHQAAAPPPVGAAPPSQTWGSSTQAATPRWSGRKTIAAVAIAIGVAGAGGVAVYAAGNASGTEVHQGPGGQGGPGAGGPGGQAPGGGTTGQGGTIGQGGTTGQSGQAPPGAQDGTGTQTAPGGMGGPGNSLSQALHGEYVVSDGASGYTTELMQTGKVTAISATSLTAVSDDGHTKTYTIDADTVIGNGSTTIDTIATGDTVLVTASTAGDTATAETLRERGTGSGRGRGGY